MTTRAHESDANGLVYSSGSAVNITVGFRAHIIGGTFVFAEDSDVFVLSGIPLWFRPLQHFGSLWQLYTSIRVRCSALIHHWGSRVIGCTQSAAIHNCPSYVPTVRPYVVPPQPSPCLLVEVAKFLLILRHRCVYEAFIIPPGVVRRASSIVKPLLKLSKPIQSAISPWPREYITYGFEESRRFDRCCSMFQRHMNPLVSH